MEQSQTGLAHRIQRILVLDNGLCPCSAEKQRDSPENDPMDPCEGDQNRAFQNYRIIPGQLRFSGEESAETEAVAPVEHVEPILPIVFLLSQQLAVVSVPSCFPLLGLVSTEPAARFQIIQKQTDTFAVKAANARKILRRKAAVLGSDKCCASRRGLYRREMGGSYLPPVCGSADKK